MIGLKVWEWSSKTLVCPDCKGKNMTADTLQVHPGELIGSVDSFELKRMQWQMMPPLILERIAFQ